MNIEVYLDRAPTAKEVLDLLDNIRLWIENEFVEKLEDVHRDAKFKIDVSEITYPMREWIANAAMELGVVPDGYDYNEEGMLE